MKTEQQVNLEFSLESLKHELDDLEQEDSLAINPKKIVENYLIMKLARLADKASEFVNAYEDNLNKAEEEFNNEESDE